MTASANLIDNHRHILLALDAADEAVRDVARGHRSLSFFENLREFIHDYADGAHYDKEDLLFAAVMAQAAPAAAPVACLDMEHHATRGQQDRLAAALEAIRKGNGDAWFDVVDATTRYVTIVRIHLPKENAGFFPMADMVLPAHVQADLVARYEEIDGKLPMSFADAAESLQQQVRKQPAAAPAPAARPMPSRFVDRFTLYDDRLGAAIELLGDVGRG